VTTALQSAIKITPIKAVIRYAKFLEENTTFYDMNTKEQITAYLYTK